MFGVLALAFLLIASPYFTVGPQWLADDFTHGVTQWTVELEKGGRVEAGSGKLTIDVPGGATVWFNRELSGPVIIQYDATAIKAGGANDRVSDLNCFWMATGTGRRSGKFEDYNDLFTYYVGQGGNSNTTTRFRRYIGSPELRPLLPEHDLREPAFLLKPNTRQRIQLVAAGPHIQYYVAGKLVFDFTDAAPYTHGRFGFRTTQSHLEIRNFRVYKLIEKRGQ